MYAFFFILKTIKILFLYSCHAAILTATLYSDIIFSVQVTQLGKFPTEPDDLDDNDVSDLAAKLRKEALQLINLLNMSAPVVSRMRSLLGRLPDHTLPDVVAAIVRSTPEEKLKVLMLLATISARLV